MGCASSKQKRCRHCQNPYSSVTRSYSMHVVHPPQQRGDTCHLVALTSSTLGSLNVNAPDHPAKTNTNDVVVPDEEAKCCNKGDKDEFLLGLIEAKSWSNMLEEKIPRKKATPRTPMMTPPGEPEVINAWELMEGLEDTSPLDLSQRFRSFSFDVSREERHQNVEDESPKLVGFNGGANVKPIWVQLVEEEEENSSHPEFDPDVLSTFRRSLQELSPDHPFYLRPKPDREKEEKQGRKKQRVVVYYTSLRGVRKTYEDCCNVRVILKGLGVKLDERDMSLHSGFKEELRELLGEGYASQPGGLPRVFVGDKYIGGADEIKKLHEDGQLERMVEGCEAVDEGGHGGNGDEIGGRNACEACGDIRFVPCDTCSGSCKVYYEPDEDEEIEELEGEYSGEFGFQRCPDCNENGLIRCPICWD